MREVSAGLQDVLGMTRWLQTNGGEAIKLERCYGTCPECGQGIFPPG